MTTIRIATRSSAQARTQAEAVGALLVAARTGVVVEYVFVDTQGDINATTPLHLGSFHDAMRKKKAAEKKG